MDTALIFLMSSPLSPLNCCFLQFKVTGIACKVPDQFSIALLIPQFRQLADTVPPAEMLTGPEILTVAYVGSLAEDAISDWAALLGELGASEQFNPSFVSVPEDGHSAVTLRNTWYVPAGKPVRLITSCPELEIEEPSPVVE
jgi:hypothetical protein